MGSTTSMSPSFSNTLIWATAPAKEGPLLQTEVNPDLPTPFQGRGTSQPPGNVLMTWALWDRAVLCPHRSRCPSQVQRIFPARGSSASTILCGSTKSLSITTYNTQGCLQPRHPCKRLTSTEFTGLNTHPTAQQQLAWGRVERPAEGCYRSARRQRLQG